MKIISLFSGAGGMDLGFNKAGFETVWANEVDKSIYPSYQNHFEGVELDIRSISDIQEGDIPKYAVGVIGGPPCQSWSEAGARRGLNDPRGKLFFEYLRVIKAVKPMFFVAENVSGLLHKKNQESFNTILETFKNLGYNVTWKLLNARDYEVPQDRERVFIVGYSDRLKTQYNFPAACERKITLREAIGDIENLDAQLDNHEYLESGYSPIFLSRNRVRGWDQQSFTILATDRHIPFHPSSPPMKKVGKDKMELDPKGKYRRLTVRECARIQTFPDNYKFIYKNMKSAYKMIGNAVPVNLAYHIAKSIMADLRGMNFRG